MVIRHSKDVTFSANHGLAYDYCHLLASMPGDANEQSVTLELRGDRDSVATCTSTMEVMAALVGIVESSHTSEIPVRALFKSELEYRFSFIISSREFGLPIELTFEDESVLLLYSRNDDEASPLPTLDARN